MTHSIEHKTVALFVCCGLTLPNDKTLDKSKLKAFADDKINVTKKLNFKLERVEIIVGKGENGDYQHFLLFPLCFQKTSYSGL